jgi:hypothetical protein
MKRPLLPLFMMLAAVPSFAQSTFQSFTPRLEADGTTYVNAEVVRVHPDGTAVVRSESGDVELTAPAGAVPGLAGLRRGDKVVIAYDTVTDDDGRTRRIVTYASPASPTSGQPGPALAVASVPASGSTVRIVSTDRANRTITVTDTSGTPMVLPVSSGAARSLGSFSAGDVVGLTFANGGVVTANALPAVNRIQALPFGTDVSWSVLPPVNGQLVRFDANTNRVTVQTASGRQRTFPVDSTAGSGLSGLRPGDNLSLNFQVTQEANRARVRAAGLGGSASSSGVLIVASVQSLGSSPVAPSTASPNAPGLSSTAAGANVTGQAGASAARTGVTGGGTFSPMGGAGNGLPFIGGVAVAAGVGPTSPYASTVPSVPAPTPMFNAVLPPATAKAPLTNEDVGAVRAFGERDLDAAAVVLAAHANEIDGHWFRLVNGCLAGFIPESSPGRQWFLLLDGRVRTPTDDSCRSMYTAVLGMAQGWEQQLGIALDAARRADVLPGRIREILDRHRIDR